MKKKSAIRTLKKSDILQIGTVIIDPYGRHEELPYRLLKGDKYQVFRDGRWVSMWFS